VTVGTGVAVAVGSGVGVGNGVEVGCVVGVSVGAKVAVGGGGTGVAVSVAVGIATTTVLVGVACASAGVLTAPAAPGGVTVKVGTGVRVGKSPWLQPLLTVSSSNANSPQPQFCLIRWLLFLPQNHLVWLYGLANLNCPLLVRHLELDTMLADLRRFCKESQ
jgi:hypothetical protein